MDVLTILSIAALITTVIGLWLLGEKDRNGFMIFNVSLLCQLYIFYKQNNWFLFAQMIILIIFNTINFSKWKGDKNE